MHMQSAFLEIENRIHSSRILTHTTSELARLDLRASSNLTLDAFRRAHAAKLPILEYSQCIPPDEIGTERTNRTSERASLGVVPVHSSGLAVHNRVSGRPLVARLSVADHRPTQTGRPRVDRDRQRAERLFAASNFNQSKTDNGF